MGEERVLAPGTYGVCDTCREPVPAEHLIRASGVFLRKHCPKCGQNERLISSDPARWQWKREVYQYEPSMGAGCSLRCEECGHDHKPRLIFLDVTNRCNLNCPICLANIPGMGFEFNPPTSYFARIFEELGKQTPPPRVELFGGEPTVREDVFELIEAARRNKVPVSVVTNGVRLADEGFCRRLCETGVDFLLAFDGPDPETYRRMRKSAGVLEKKLQAIENIRRFSKRKHTLVCTLARDLNDKDMPEHFAFAHANRALFRRLFFIPLTETWEAGEYHAGRMTTPEDAEHILEDAFPGEKLEFFPAGLLGYLLPALRFFGTERIRFAGVHPNCESAAFVVSDGERYLPLTHFLKRPLAELLPEIVARAKKVNPRLERLSPKRWFQRWRGRLLALRTYGRLLLGAVNFRKVFTGSRVLGLLRIIGGAVIGRRFSEQLRRHTHVHDGVPIVILPFEEWHSLEAGRMRKCSAAFVYVDPQTDQVSFTPFCMWCMNRREMFRKIAARYGAQPHEAARPAVAATAEP
ncbi:MAG: radical SAM protein [Planctomycetes bacterium]|nr:radical SAM protein [Planctomycetota bacterium]